MPDTTPSVLSFRDLDLPAPLLAALDEVGYETPSPIQTEAIPYLLQGLDLLGHAPTGTGKTAAFALPLLARLDLNARHVQIMTLTPTRELAIQVAEAFQRYASHLAGFHVLPIYGGQEYSGQLRQLKRGVQVVVGTPGRVVDHMRRGTLKVDKLQALVLDEADEMLRMGFIEEVEWILDQTPARRQMALFSATMPKEVERIARRHLHAPQEISIKSRTATAETIRQRYWLVSGLHKLDALTRILEVEPFDAILMFVRTKTATTELAEKLEARGYAAAAMNGDMAQSQREQMVARLKKGSLDILVATDVAARGLDVDRISHVVNYDIPYDTEAYIHRIGRTGRAGRTGQAILFVSPRERRMLNAIEKATRQKIEPLELPSTEVVNNKRISDFKQKIGDTLAAGELAFMQSIIEQYQQEHDVPALEIAAALAKMVNGDRPMLMRPDKVKATHIMMDLKHGKKRAEPRKSSSKSYSSRSDADKERYRINVGYRHGVKPGNIVGAIANEAGLDSEHIGHIEIETNFTLIDLPKGIPKEVIETLKAVKVCGKRLDIVRFDKAAFKGGSRAKESYRKKGKAADGSQKKKTYGKAKTRKTVDPGRVAKTGDDKQAKPKKYDDTRPAGKNADDTKRAASRPSGSGAPLKKKSVSRRKSTLPGGVKPANKKPKSAKRPPKKGAKKAVSKKHSRAGR